MPKQNNIEWKLIALYTCIVPGDGIIVLIIKTMYSHFS